MKVFQIKKMIFSICLLSIFIFPHKTQGISTIVSAPDNFQFSSVTLNGGIQSVSGGSGKIVVRDVLGLLENWRVTVKATPFTQIGGSGLRLPMGSLQLQRPTAGNTSYNKYICSGSPWTIDRVEPTEILNNGLLLLGIGNFYSFDFGSNPFTLTIYPNVKIIDEGKHPRHMKQRLHGHYYQQGFDK